MSAEYVLYSERVICPSGESLREPFRLGRLAAAVHNHPGTAMGPSRSIKRGKHSVSAALQRSRCSCAISSVYCAKNLDNFCADACIVSRRPDNRVHNANSNTSRTEQQRVVVRQSIHLQVLLRWHSQLPASISSCSNGALPTALDVQ